jgi:hypothetical protein
MSEKIIRFTVDKKFYDEVRDYASREGYGRKSMSRFYRNALEHYLDYLQDKNIQETIEGAGIERIKKGLEKYYAKMSQEKNKL